MEKNDRKRKIIMLAAGVAVVAVMSLFWAHGRLDDQRSAAENAMNDTVRCGQLAKQIRSLRTQPTRVQSQELQNTEFSQRIETAAKKAGIARQNLIRITPDPARQIDRTPYKRKPTRVSFNRVTMPQLVAFLLELSAEEAGPEVTRLRLTEAGTNNNKEVWIVEVTLTYLIYAPRPTSPMRAS